VQQQGMQWHILLTDWFEQRQLLPLKVIYQALETVVRLPQRLLFLVCSGIFQ
jgi:hypothetical protein